ncbi:hypothetical protein D3C87_1399000 [compost metagenome]
MYGRFGQAFQHMLGRAAASVFVTVRRERAQTDDRLGIQSAAGCKPSNANQGVEAEQVTHHRHRWVEIERAFQHLPDPPLHHLCQFAGSRITNQAQVFRRQIGGQGIDQFQIMQQFLDRLPGVSHQPLEQGQVVQGTEGDRLRVSETEPLPVLPGGQSHQHGRTEPQFLHNVRASNQKRQQVQHFIADVDLVSARRHRLQRPGGLKQQQVNTAFVDPFEQRQHQVLGEAQVHRQAFLHDRTLRVPGLEQQG